MYLLQTYSFAKTFVEDTVRYPHHILKHMSTETTPSFRSMLSNFPKIEPDQNIL